LVGTTGFEPVTLCL